MTIKDEEQVIPKKKYKLILDNSNDLIAILNKDFEHEYINERAYLNILGYSKEDIIGKRVRDFTHP
ncbi:MAG: PAS domain S-box protein, partial [Candidatus Lokiarchaeota archaeon]|nr:PAS domain S-box protein [Candidatus Lokiarchaeota archaeon]